MPQPDAAVVALARDGDSEAFRALVERHSRAVYRLAHRMTGTPQDAEDVVQETFLKAYKQLSRFESRANFSTWLHRIAVNCSIDLIRSRPHRETGRDSSDLEQFGADARVEAGRASPERLMLSTEVQDRVNSAMAALSRMERAAFVLRHFEGQSIDEISRALGLKTNATKHSIFRAVKKCASCSSRSSLETSGGHASDRKRKVMHIGENDLILHYYGEMDARAEAQATSHLGECSTCNASYAKLQQVLAAVEAAPPPELPEGFDRVVWARLEPTLHRRRGAWLSWAAVSPARLAGLAAILALVAGAFFAGRNWRDTTAPPATATATAPLRERVLLVDLGEHLDRSQMMLVELVSAGADRDVDMSFERERAAQLVSANRLYRQTAAATGNAGLADVLDQLERVLVDVAASPDELSGARLEQVRQQIERKGLLFKVRVLSSEVRERQKTEIRNRTGQSL